MTKLDDYEVKLDVLDLVENGPHMRGPPSHATSDFSNTNFWAHFQHVCEMQAIRMADENADAELTIGMPLPDIMKGYSLAEVAEAVHDEVRSLKD